MTIRPLIVGAAALVALPAYAVQDTAPAAIDLWRADPDETSPAALAALAEDSTVLRWRPIELIGAEALVPVSNARIALELFDGRRVEVDLERRAQPRPGSASFLGAIGAAGDHLALALVDGAAEGTLWLDEHLFAVTNLPDGQAVLVERTLTAPGTCALGPEHHVDTLPTQGAARRLRRAEDPSTDPGGPLTDTPDFNFVDVVTAYTPEARQAQGGTAQILALIDLAVLETNVAYDNCGADLVLRLAYSGEVVYTESGSMSTDLSRLRSKTDGYMDEVHSWRDVYGGDAVALIVSGGGACGVAYLMTNVSPGFQSSAFSVTARGCATGYYSYGHELGHNFGCAHDRDNAGSSSHSFGYGYRTPNNLYRTVMAYSPGSRKPIFSSPDHFWNGYVMGAAGTEDNAQALTLNAPTVAAWRDAVIEVADCNSNGIPDGIEIADGLVADIDGNEIPDTCQSLTVDKLELSLVLGGTQTLSFDAGPARAGDIYFVLGSLAGTDVGFPLGLVTVPLNQDVYFDLTLASPTGTLVQGGAGVLDGLGRATAAFVLPPGVGQFQLTLTPVNHAFVVVNDQLVPDLASNPAPAQFIVF
ncbi:reprolysin-like metallopeptidase [Engelhardtia mirabilis]|uniref:Metallo-peptidase family M12B Reprolysin-like n=1 Tax=Engelhardtia mirabilis TaxID=2528011 RepID=A0A518BNY5_9BACT|nr:hypothetical protein Pla133_37950 [Planctomycetes bacterium Pla133]QDV03019.1 hypothetical protein Pla86_37940 [Planctomycetes bacterium Pla86]